MYHRSFIPVVLFGALALATTARGEPAAVWSYRMPFNETVIALGVTGGFSFPNEPFASATGDGLVEIGKLLSWSIAAAATPDRVSDLPYQFAVELRDDRSGESGLLTFAGALSGSYWRSGSELTADFADDVRTLDLGGLRYELRLAEFDAPTGYGPENGGAFRASVRVTAATPRPEDDDPQGPVGGGAEAPEPATLLLAAVGLPAVRVFRAVCRRRASA